MRLKCIGGFFDGTHHEIGGLYRVGDQLRIAEPQKFELGTFAVDVEAIRNNQPTPPMIIKYHIYRIALFYFTKSDCYKFLVCDGWTDKQAIMHQFSK